ncbi:hypothetical protein [Reyranella sp. CPCC 100927]|uniref:virion core protein, T7 gp14 family n=1 Tax=Reyranella sp. CPCC 100927 TaxID=2599616 RepID=UPI0011B827F7|nr:hypothetical protein [Reyranella sp. CPCC 100927]TWS94989.1 hypothetical protein FQU96_40790 [Reyranella sp. CPCC 100927]
MALATFAVGAASAGASYTGQQSAAKAQNKQYAANAESARRAASESYASLQQRIDQERAATIDEQFQTAIDAKRAGATATVAAGEAGVNGHSIDALLADYKAQQGRFNANTQQNLRSTEGQLRQEMKGVQAQAETRINSVPRGQKPSFIDAGLRIIGAGIGAYSDRERWIRGNPESRG